MVASPAVQAVELVGTITCTCVMDNTRHIYTRTQSPQGVSFAHFLLAADHVIIMIILHLCFPKYH
jgi:hypothetical protein